MKQIIYAALFCGFLVTAQEFDLGKIATYNRIQYEKYGKNTTVTRVPEGLKSEFTAEAGEAARKGFSFRPNNHVNREELESITIEITPPEGSKGVGIMWIDTQENLYSVLPRPAAAKMTFAASDLIYRYNNKVSKAPAPEKLNPVKVVLIYAEYPRGDVETVRTFLLHKVTFEKRKDLGANWLSPDWGYLQAASREDKVWKQFTAPGDGGTSWYLRIHPANHNVMVQSCDMGGNYMTWDGSSSYQSINNADWSFPRIAYVSGADFCTSAPETGYIATEKNGLWKTVDYGKTWSELDTSVLEHKFKGYFPKVPLSTVAVNPLNVEQVWAGIGQIRCYEYKGGDKKRLPQGAIRSTDGGKTWEHLDNIFPKDQMALAFLFFPKHPELMVIGTDGGVFLSEDSGKNFREITGNLPQPVYFGGFDGIEDPATGLPVIAAAMETEYTIGADGAVKDMGGVWKLDWKSMKWQETTGNLRIPKKLIDELPDLKHGLAGSPWWKAGSKILWREFLARPEVKKIYDEALFVPGGKSGEFFKLWKQAKTDEAIRARMKTVKEGLDTVLPDLHTVRIDPRNPDVMYVSVFQADLPYGLWKTTDGGKRWYQVCRGARGWETPEWQEYVPAGEPKLNLRQSWTRRQPMNYGTAKNIMGFWDIRRFDLSKSNPDVLYFHSHRITYRSTDGGKSWTDASNQILDEKKSHFKGLGNSNMCMYGLQFNQKDPSRMLVWMADSGIKVSRDGGNTIFALEETMIGSNQYVYSAAFDPDDPDRFFLVFNVYDWLVGGIKGSYFLETRNYGDSFIGLSNPENGTLVLPPKQKELTNYVGNIMVDPQSPKENRRLIASHAMFNRHTLFSTEVYSKDPTNPARGIIESTDSGKTWHNCNEGLPGIQEIVDVFTPDNWGTLYASAVKSAAAPTSGGLFKSLDRGKTWSRMEVPCDSVTQTVYSSGKLFISGGVMPKPRQEMKNDGGIWCSEDNGKTWTKLLGAPLVNNLAVNPENPNLIYCTIDDGKRGSLIPSIGVWHSEDGGKTWSRMNKGLAFPWSLMCLTWHPVNKNELYLGTFGSGFYKLEE